MPRGGDPVLASRVETLRQADSSPLVDVNHIASVARPLDCTSVSAEWAAHMRGLATHSPRNH
eukprot:SAG31_NODE_17250_length_678_cov_0.694301_1_plen_62_part_01